MKSDHIWKEIQNSMAIEGYEISDAFLEEIKESYEKDGREQMIQKLVAKVGDDVPLDKFKSILNQLTDQFRKVSGEN